MELKKKHLIEYSIFLVVFSFLLILYVVFRHDKNLHKLLSALISSVYTLWGIIHSAWEKRLTPAIVFEYVLFGVLAFLLLFIVLSFE